MQNAAISEAVESSRATETLAARTAPLQPPAAHPTGPETSQVQRPEHQSASNRGSVLMEFAMLGLLLAGGVGIVRATQMENSIDVLVCLLGSAAGCGLVCYLYFHRD